jgi:hypothetical protein
MAERSISFIADEHLRLFVLTSLLQPRGHSIERLDLAAKDPEILLTAEERGAVILSSDKRYFWNQLAHNPKTRIQYQKAGLVILPGEWSSALALLREFIPVIEAVYQVTRERTCQRFAVKIEKPSRIDIHLGE